MMIRRSWFHVLVYGLSLALLLCLLQWLELKFIILSHAYEIYFGAIALLFTGLGGWLGLKLTKPKIQTVVIEKKFYTSQHNLVRDEQMLAKLGISTREMEVLQLMAAGLSNKEIADKLFVSVNTIKTHTSNLFQKLGAERRTQAVDQARKLGLVL